MNLKLDPARQDLLLGFIANARRFPLDKKLSTLLARLFDDVKRNQINSQRFMYALPSLRAFHNSMRTIIAQRYRYSNIPRWQRLLFFPALLSYLFGVVPTRRRLNRSQDDVARVVNFVRGLCEGKQDAKQDPKEAK